VFQTLVHLLVPCAFLFLFSKPLLISSLTSILRMSTGMKKTRGFLQSPSLPEPQNWVFWKPQCMGIRYWCVLEKCSGVGLGPLWATLPSLEGPRVLERFLMEASWVPPLHLLFNRFLSCGHLYLVMYTPTLVIWGGLWSPTKGEKISGSYTPGESWPGYKTS
jgi:hypothetical protein